MQLELQVAATQVIRTAVHMVRCDATTRPRDFTISIDIALLT